MAGYAYVVEFGTKRRVFIRGKDFAYRISGSLNESGYRGVTTGEAPFFAVWDYADEAAYFLTDSSGSPDAASPSRTDLEAVLEALEFTDPGEIENPTVHRRKRPV